MAVATLLIWLSCVLTFVSTRQQKLMVLKLPKWLVWCIFTLLISVSWYFMAADYPWVSAGLQVLATMMLMWVFIVLSHGHLKLTLVPFTLAGATISMVLAQLGGL